MVLTLALLLAPLAARAQDTPAFPTEARLRVVSWNVWGIPLITPRWADRISPIAERVRSLGGDVVGLQEVWFRADAEAIVRALADRYPHHAIFDAPGRAGLVVLSRWPIEAPSLRVFGANGYPHYLLFGEADWFSGKGVATMRIATPWGALPFADTHMIAAHRTGTPRADRFVGHRLAQVVEAAGPLRAVAATSPLPLVLTGDLNALLGSDEILTLRGLTDLESAQEASPDAAARAESGRMIDYVLAAPTAAYTVTVERCVVVEAGLTRLADGEEVPLSDHDAVVADLVMARRVSGEGADGAPASPPVTSSSEEAPTDGPRTLAPTLSAETVARARERAVARLASEAHPGPVSRLSGPIAALALASLGIALLRRGGPKRDLAAGRPLGSPLANLAKSALLLGTVLALAEVAVESFDIAPRTAAAIGAARDALLREAAPR